MVQWIIFGSMVWFIPTIGWFDHTKSITAHIAHIVILKDSRSE